MLGGLLTIGTMAVVGRDSTIGPDGVLEDLSMLPATEQLGAGEVWSGSPARRIGEAPARPQPTPPGLIRKALVSTGLVLAALVLPVAAVLPIGPGLIMIIELDWATTGYGYIAVTPLLAVIYVLAMCALTVVVKWALIGRVKPGTYSLWSGFYVRLWFVRQLGELALDLLHPLYATLYVRPWYLALGARVGKRAEISTATSVVPDLIEIGAESFIADGVVFGAPRAVPGAIQLANTRIGRHALINRGALLGHDIVTGECISVGPGANIGGACRILSGCYIGMGAIVIERLSIGEGSVVAAGAVVHRDVPAQVLVAGVPAVALKHGVDGL